MVYATEVIIDGEAIWGDAKGIKPYVKATLQTAVYYWHRKFLGKHFRAGAAARYGYKPRSPKYIRRKKNKKHHSQPLVWSGDTRKSVRTSIRVGGTSKQATGRMVAPWYIKMVPQKRNAPALGDEIARVAPVEMEEINAFMARDFAERVQKHRGRKTIRIAA